MFEFQAFAVLLAVIIGILITASQALGPKLGWTYIAAFWGVLLCAAIIAVTVSGQPNTITGSLN